MCEIELKTWKITPFELGSRPSNIINPPEHAGPNKSASKREEVT